MKWIYPIIFFLGMVLICWLAYGIFAGIDKGCPVWRQAVLVVVLGGLIFAMALFIRHYLGEHSDPNDK